MRQRENEDAARRQGIADTALYEVAVAVVRRITCVQQVLLFLQLQLLPISWTARRGDSPCVCVRVCVCVCVIGGAAAGVVATAHAVAPHTRHNCPRLLASRFFVSSLDFGADPPPHGAASGPPEWGVEAPIPPPPGSVTATREADGEPIFNFFFFCW